MTSNLEIRNRLPGISLAVTLGLFGALCSAGDVKAYPSKNIDFSQFKTYSFLPAKVLMKTGIVEDDPDISPLMKKAVKEQLEKKGLVEVSQGGDLQVATLALQTSVPQLEALIFSPYMDANTGWGTSPIATIGRYNREGTLAVNMIDPRTNRSVWLGMATKALGRPSNRGHDIDTAAADLVKKYPGKP